MGGEGEREGGIERRDKGTERGGETGRERVRGEGERGVGQGRNEEKEKTGL